MEAAEVRTRKFALVLAGLMTCAAACQLHSDPDPETPGPVNSDDAAGAAENPLDSGADAVKSQNKDAGIGTVGAGGADGAGAGGSGGSPITGASGSKIPDAARPVKDGPNVPEICDGIDNDGNGIVDDLDVGGDGICDCLRIATLGKPGTWGMGDVFQAWLSTRSKDGAVALADRKLTPELLAPFEIIIVQDVSSLGRNYEASEIAVVQDWVNAGGGLMTLTGYGEPPEVFNVNALLAPFGMSYGSDQIMKKAGALTVPVTVWLNQSLSAGVKEVGMDNGHPVLGKGSDVAQGEGFALGKVQYVQSGRLFVWGDEWVTYSTEWTQHTDYQVDQFWVNAVSWLSPPKECRLAAEP